MAERFLGILPVVVLYLKLRKYMHMYTVTHHNRLLTSRLNPSHRDTRRTNCQQEKSRLGLVVENEAQLPFVECSSSQQIRTNPSTFIRSQLQAGGGVAAYFPPCHDVRFVDEGGPTMWRKAGTFSLLLSSHTPALSYFWLHPSRRELLTELS